MLSKEKSEMPKDLEKSAKVLIVNFPFLIAVMVLCLNLTPNVQVDCFLLNPDYVVYLIHDFLKNSIFCFNTNFSFIFDNAGKTDIVLQLGSCSGI